jgi:hypothetical protein
MWLRATIEAVTHRGMANCAPLRKISPAQRGWTAAGARRPTTQRFIRKPRKRCAPRAQRFAELAAALGVGISTIWEWKASHPEFSSRIRWVARKRTIASRAACSSAPLVTLAQDLHLRLRKESPLVKRLRQAVGMPGQNISPTT